MGKTFDYILVIKNQLIILGLVLLFKILVSVDLLPNEIYLIQLLNHFFEKYGVLAIVLASFLENIIGIGSYFPGSIVILTGMALTNGDINKAIITFLCIIFPSTLSHCINYFLGKKLSRYRNLGSKSLSWFLISTLWHPHFAAVSTFTLGGQGLKFYRFLYIFFPIHFGWNLFWGLVMYNLGRMGSTNYSFLNLFYAYMLIWILWDCFKYYKRQ